MSQEESDQDFVCANFGYDMASPQHVASQN